MSSRPTVVAAIVTRDRPTVLARAVRSALAQSYPAIEVWVADDGSQPPVSLPADLEERVNVLRLDETGGAGAARNDIVARSTGELLAFLDDDDEWFPRKTERQVEVLQAGADDVAAVDAGFEMWRGGRLLYRYVPLARRDISRELLARPVMAPSTVLMRRSAFEDLGGFDPDLGRCEDWFLWVRMVDRFRVAAVEEVLARRWDLGELRPEVGLHDYRLLVERLEPRIDSLPPGERSRLRALHAFNTGVWLSRVGDRAGARRALLEAWRENPAELRPLLHLPRTVTGEPLWEAAASVLREANRRTRSAIGMGDPWLRRW